MLQSLLPKAHHKFRALPLLGPIADGFDDWLASSGYTPGSRKFSIRFLKDADEDLRKRGVREIAALSQPILYEPGVTSFGYSPTMPARFERWLDI